MITGRDGNLYDEVTGAPAHECNLGRSEPWT
jgi:hypothetical protein